MLITYVHGCRQYSPKENMQFIYVYNSTLTRTNCPGVGTLTGSDSTLQCSSPNGDFEAFHMKWGGRTKLLTETSCGGVITPIPGHPGWFQTGLSW
ncbi:hypothetical protein SeLEV6574_g02874 [Synchytrium endobioticum]|uniref:Uncharacterized protein n=1 Tax=Synchytrium endobioticum TaxID=286115 RepID=A0A507D6B5_9FUNG|nr:hypothetical protein SeLEV6574_g02874 [Synchytrium endobioticum]